jgi:hypothetical protein
VCSALNNMRFVATLLIIGTLIQFGSAQSCSTFNYGSCSSCLSAGLKWCSSFSSYPGTLGCCQSTSFLCSSSNPYSFRYGNCNIYDSYDFGSSSVVTYSICGTTCIIVNIIWSIAWIVNMVAVIRYCRQHNIEPCGFIAIAFFFGWFVWCCLISRGRQQLVIVQTGNVQYQPHVQAGAYNAQPPQPYGQPSYGQPYGGAQQGGYAPPAQPINPYTQPSYGQQGGVPPNPYAQPANPYGEISKPQ